MSLSDTARPAVAEMRRRNAEPVIRFLKRLDQDQAEAFIGHLTLLLAELRDQAGLPRGGTAAVVGGSGSGG